MTQLNPYLHFGDNARQAMEFYQSVFGGDLQIMAFKDMPMPGMEAEGDKVMHSALVAKDISFFASDTPSHMQADPGNSISMSLSGEDENELRGYFDKLAEGGNVMQPLEKAPWGDTFGMLRDRFGIEWLVNVNSQHQQ
jgi:PhnB protein